MLAVDFGDAPAAYPVTLAEDGARHDIPAEGAEGWLPSSGSLDGEVADYLGTHVAISGDGNTVISVGDGLAGSKAYRRGESGWSQLGSDFAPIVNSRVILEIAVSFNGNVVAFGGQGRTDVIRFDGTDWSRVPETINDEAFNDQSGSGVALSDDGNTLAIGAWANDGNGQFAGHVRVFRFTGGQWTQIGSDIDGEAASDRLGLAGTVSLSADGNTLAVGTRYNGGAGADSGHVRVFRFAGGNWDQVGADIDGKFAGDRLGGSVWLTSDANTVIATSASLPRTYQFDTLNGWVETGTIGIDTPGTNLSAPIDFSGDGNTVIVGGFSFSEDPIRVFAFENSTWSQVGPDITRPVDSEAFGEAVAIDADGSSVVIGDRFKGLTPGSDDFVTGATHVYDRGQIILRLGDTRDSEADGIESDNADGDGSDEDGVQFENLTIGIDQATAIVSVSGHDGKLDGWIDFNHDGDWDDAGEQIFTSTEVSVGPNQLVFPIPAEALSGVTYARLRLSTVGGLSPTGAAADGEVEDYQIELLSGTTNPTLDEIADRTLVEDQKQIVVLVPTGDSPGRIDQIDLKTGAMLGSFGESELQIPSDVAVGPDGHYYVMDRGTRNIEKYDSVTMAHLESIATTERGETLLVGDSGHFYVGEASGGDIIELLPDGTTLRVLQDREGPADMDLGRGNQILYAGGRFQQRAQLFDDTVDFQTNSTFHLPGDLADGSKERIFQAVAVGASGEAYTASYNVTDDVFEIWNIDLQKRAIVSLLTTRPGHSDVFDIDFGPDHHLYLTASDQNQIIVVDAQTGATLNTIDHTGLGRHTAWTTLPNLHPIDANIDLTGISAGGNEMQPLMVTAISDQPDVVPDPIVTYTSGDDSGQLTIAPLENQSGIANITVTVTDGGPDNNLATPEDNVSTSRTFQINVEASASVAHDDLFYRRFDFHDSISIRIDDLLLNDVLGQFESLHDLSLSVSNQSKQGGLVEIDAGILTYTPPADWFLGVDEITYTIDDGNTSSGTIYIANGIGSLGSAGFFRLTLEPGQSHDVILTRDDTHLFLLDRPTNEEILKVPLKVLQSGFRQNFSVDLTGAPDHQNLIEVRNPTQIGPPESFCGNGDALVPSVAQSLTLHAGNTGTDEVVIAGQGWEWLRGGGGGNEFSTTAISHPNTCIYSVYSSNFEQDIVL